MRHGLRLTQMSGSRTGGLDTIRSLVRVVIRVRRGRTEWIDVKTGLASGSLVEVFADLDAGDEITARGTDEIRAGTEVRVKQAKPAAS